jgi:tight adherence protein B
MQPLLVALLAFAAIFLLEAVFYSVRYLSDRRTEELKRRLQSLGTVQQESFALLRQGKLSAAPVLDALLRAAPFTQQLESLLEQAQIGITVARLLTYGALAAGGAAIAGALLGGASLALFLGGLGGAVPLLMVLVARERRNAKLSEQLPEALDMMARSLRAGHSLASAFKMVATELPAPINVEFGRAFEEQNLGMPFERAVIQMTKRAPRNRELKIFAVSVILQKETGGNLVEIAESLAELVRQRYRFYGKLRTLTAEGRLSSYVLGALPILTGGFLAATNPSYISLLVTNRTGNFFLGYAILTWILGFLWMRRMAKVAL